jgi:hypothetical protein
MIPRNQAVLLSPMKLLVTLLLSIFINSSIMKINQPPTHADMTVVENKPLFSYFLLEQDLIDDLQRYTHFSDQMIDQLVQISTIQQKKIIELESSTFSVLNDPKIDKQAKQEYIRSSGYNARYKSILQDSRLQAQALLSSDGYEQLILWLQRKWNIEKKENIKKSAIYDFIKHFTVLPEKQYPRSFEIYATRYDAGDRYVIALPDKCLKFANAQVMKCSSGYQYGMNYSVAISYKGKFVVAPVLEAGPWNIDDNYWSTTQDPQPRRMFTDLGLGIPEAQAAFYYGYNGGVDQYGRTVTSPVAIDISYSVSKDLKLDSGNNKVTVSFLWTEGWDQPGSAVNPIESTVPIPDTKTPVIIPILWTTSTPNLDGSVIHVVQSGQTLIGISSVYQVPLDELFLINNLTKSSVIYPGDQIIVKPARQTATLTSTIIPTFTLTPSPKPPTLTSSLTSTVTILEPTQPGLIPETPTVDHLPVQKQSNSPVLLIILIIGGLLLIAIIIWYLLPQQS